jgi:hypothetical protein
MRWRLIVLVVFVSASAGSLVAPGAPEPATYKENPKAKNLVANGDFEKGKDSPEGRRQVAGLARLPSTSPFA